MARFVEHCDDINCRSGRFTTALSCDHSALKFRYPAWPLQVNSAAATPPPAYERHIASSFAEWNPATDREKAFVQSLDDWEPEQFGFEFSLSQIEVRAIELKPDLFDAWYAEHPEELVA